jgi:hypothetical protein
LAQAYSAVGRGEDAAQWWRRIVDSTDERLAFPCETARSTFQLAEQLAAEGQRSEAATTACRFLDSWRDGDLEREWVQAAEELCASGG